MCQQAQNSPVVAASSPSPSGCCLWRWLLHPTALGSNPTPVHQARKDLSPRGVRSNGSYGEDLVQQLEEEEKKRKLGMLRANPSTLQIHPQTHSPTKTACSLKHAVTLKATLKAFQCQKQLLRG